ncbi:MAG: hypothetical protein KA260_03930 [Burkholderiales bacterium]|nr:hypothetical protein [Burkholderiales bacterium]
MSKFVDVFVPIAALLSVFIGAGTLLIWMLSEDQKTRDKKLVVLREELWCAIVRMKPSWDELVEMASVSGHNAGDVYVCLRKIHKDLLIGKPQTSDELPRDVFETATATKTDELRHLIQSYISKHKAAEPFEGLPAETRVHLERLQSAMGDDPRALEPLTTQIRELVSVYEKEKKRQQRYTAWGFFLAVASFLFAAWTYFNPYVAVK